MRYGHRIGQMLAGAGVSFILATAGGSGTATAAPAPLPLSSVPLFLSTGAEPNVMIMVDNSGSMTNIVPDLPYVATTTHLATCPVASTVLPGTQVELRVRTGVPKILVGGLEYDYGTAATERCFTTGSDYLAKLWADAGTPLGTATTTYLPSQYKGNYLNWYFSTATDPATGCTNTWTGSGRKPCSKSRLMVAKTAGSNLVDIMSSGVRAGLSTYNDGNGGRLLETVDSLTATKRTALRTAIDAMAPSGTTPLAETLSDIGWYFSRGATNLVLHPTGTPSTQTRANVFATSYIRHASWSNGVNPIQYSCQKSFTVMVTDGRPQSDRDVTTHLRDYTGDCASGLCDATSNGTNIPAGPLTVTTNANGTKIGRAYEAQGSDYLDDVAKALHDIDLRPDLVSLQGIKNDLVSYVISFADDQAINDPLLASTAAHGGGEFSIAGNEGELQDALTAAMSSIARRTSSASAVATNSTRLDTNTLVYQARFRSDDWTGQLIGYELNLDGTLGAEQWLQDNVIPAPNDRTIYTKKTDGTVVAFQWANLDVTQKAYLDLVLPGTTDDDRGEQRVAWLRGDHSLEQQNTPPATTPIYPFRNRSTELGDIVNSDPQFVGAQNFGYNALPTGTAGKTTYLAYRQSKLSDSDNDGVYSVAKPMIYVGANDGMLHGFDAVTGVERFAYVPSTLIDDLPYLTNPAYTHRYFVDGPIAVGDAYIDTPGPGAAAWATVLVGTTGAGDKTVFALDVTDPHNFGANDVLWEFTDADLGHALGQPSIARMANGKWVAVFGNGYNSTNHKAVLFIVDLETGALIKKIDTLAGDASNANGLGTPSLLADATRTIRAVYAGDLHGNLWEFDVTDTATSNPAWVVANSGAALFVARDAAGTPQPITAPAEIGRHPNGGYMIYFGTGKFFATGDNVVNASTQIQSFYAIWDKTSAGAITDTDRTIPLQAQTILSEQTPSGSQFLVRVTSNFDVAWATRRGWFLDLDAPAAGPEGERVVSLPVLRNNKIIFPTLVPSTTPCEFGGSSWLMELDAVSGKRLVDTPLDINENGTIDNGDRATITIAGSPTFVSVSGIRSGEGIIDTPAIVEIPGEDEEVKIASGTSGNVESVRERGDTGQARGSWRQLR